MKRQGTNLESSGEISDLDSVSSSQEVSRETCDELVPMHEKQSNVVPENRQLHKYQDKSKNNRKINNRPNSDDELNTLQTKDSEYSDTNKNSKESGSSSPDMFAHYHVEYDVDDVVSNDSMIERQLKPFQEFGKGIPKELKELISSSEDKPVDNNNIKEKPVCENVKTQSTLSDYEKENKLVLSDETNELIHSTTTTTDLANTAKGSKHVGSVTKANGDDSNPEIIYDKIEPVEKDSCKYRFINPIALRIMRDVESSANNVAKTSSSEHVAYKAMKSSTTVPSQKSETLADPVLNMACIDNLASEVGPSANYEVIIRSGNQLINTYRNAVADSVLTETLMVEVFKLTHIVLLKMDQIEDTQVARIFIEEEDFISRLVTSLDSASRLVVRPALELLKFLSRQQRLHSVQVTTTHCVKDETIVKLMSSLATKYDSVDLVSELFVPKTIQPLIALPAVLPDLFYISIHLESTSLTVEFFSAWRCLALMLKYCHNSGNSNMELHLLTNIMAHYAIERTLESKEKGWTNGVVLEYIHAWLDGLSRNRKKLIRDDYSRALCQDRLSKVLSLLASTLVQQENLEDPSINSIGTKICNLGGNIPPEVIQTLRAKVQSE